uniref:EGF-like domain-containing protein n=3 Tax=Ciona intestinalis TaxID=7719 RepID=F6VN18_CIOIN
MLRVCYFILSCLVIGSISVKEVVKNKWSGTIFEESGDGDICGTNEEFNGEKCVCIDRFVNSTKGCVLGNCFMPNACNGQGACEQGEVLDSYTCNCTGIWEGKDCENTKFCSVLNPCNGHGECTDNACNCTENWFGDRCNEQGICLTSDYCNGHGKCVPGISTNSASCECEDGYSGGQCKTYDECSTATPCSGNGTCYSVDGEWNCTCDKNYDGDTCDNSVSGSCSDTPCGDHGACSVIENGFTCLCDAGFIGDTCNVEDPCVGITCNGHGDCKGDLSGSYECTCIEGWSGDNCTSAKYCSSENACNGNKCTAVDPDFKCNCTGAYKGKTCDIAICPEISETHNKTVIKFPEALTSTSSTSDVICPPGTINENKAYASKQCLMIDGYAKWEQTKFLDCDTPLEMLSITDKCSAIEVITSDL